MTAEAIAQSLNLVADRVGDPVPLVYQRLFEKHPELKPLFILDTDDSAKGNMLATVFDLFFDHLEEGAYATSFIESEIINHENLGVPREVFAAFFSMVMETFKDVLGGDWTADMEKTWSSLVADLATVAR